MISISSIPCERSLCSYNGAVALKKKLNKPSSQNNRSFIHFLRRGGKKYHYAANLLPFSVCMIRNKSPDFQLSIDLNGIIIIFI